MSPVPVSVPSAPVEARSLSSITAIAANPPAYPRNPTHEKHDPLQLYIVRVPGSRDIFLSPVKPPTKSSVSAEAINASLYYLHVATPEDDALLHEVELERDKQLQQRKEELEAAGADGPAQREFARLNNVRRKPVGGERELAGQENIPPSATLTAPTPAQANAAAPKLHRRPVPVPHVSAEDMSYTGPPIMGILTAPLSERRDGSVDSMGNTVPRRPLPPLPPSEEPLFRDASSAEDQPRKTNRWSAFVDNVQTRGKDVWREKYEAIAAGRHSLDANRPQLPARSSHNHARNQDRSPEQSPNRQLQSSRPRRTDAGFHITLIRRDPASGMQWNVATITTPRMDCNAIDIEISTPGYNRFIASNEPLSLTSLAANLPPDALRSAGSSLSASLKLDQLTEPRLQTQPQATGPRKFHRQLCVSRQFEDPNGIARSSADFSNAHVPEGSKLKSGYYVFNSPWNGICTFSTSVNGRSLKCKHMISTPGKVPSGDGDANPAVTVAEIRFNTPFQAANLHFHASQRQNNHPHSHHHQQHPSRPKSSSASTIPTSPRHVLPDPSNPESGPKRNPLSQFLNPTTFSRPRAQSGPNHPSTTDPSTPTGGPRNTFSPTNLIRRTSLRAARFSRQGDFRHFYPPPPTSHHHRSTSTSSGGPDSDEDRLDFSLARELAGGGMRGKSAKLGKLVIEDEGMKMLDLVVAACMAVWWRGYYH